MEGGGKAARGKMKNEDLGEIMKKGKGETCIKIGI